MNAAKKPRVVSYIRIGTAAQQENPYRLEIQRNRAREQAESLGYEIVGEFFDVGASFTEYRPGLDSMLAIHEQLGFEKILVWAPETLMRGSVKFISLQNQLAEKGIGIVANGVDLNMDMMTNLANMLTQIAEPDSSYPPFDHELIQDFT